MASSIFICSVSQLPPLFAGFNNAKNKTNNSANFIHISVYYYLFSKIQHTFLFSSYFAKSSNKNPILMAIFSMHEDGFSYNTMIIPCNGMD